MRGQIRGTALVAFVTGATVLAGCSAGKTESVHATMSVSSKSAVADVPISVRVAGLPAGKTLTLTSSAQDDKVRWTASAEFTVPADGVVTTAMSSKRGSYTGPDSMGLFEFMAPPKGSSATLKNEAFVPFWTGHTFNVTLQAKLGGKVVATSVAQRLTTAPGVTTKQLRPATDGVYGELFQPAKTARDKPAVLVFGGSEGGMSMSTLAGQLASHGYPALALAYFAAPGLPSTLRDIPLEYFVKALHILRAQRDVDPRRVFVLGDSRGSEAAMLLGAHYPQLVNGVIGGSPNPVSNSSLPYGGHAAWTLDGKALPYVPINRFGTLTGPATIPVEKIRGPILLVCGTDDTLWPSCPSETVIQKKLTAHHFKYPVTALRYKGAGHMVGSMSAYYSSTQTYYSQIAADGFALGGRLRLEKPAEAASHQALLKFLAAQH